MNSSKLIQKVSNYLVVLYLWVNDKNSTNFNSKDITVFLEKNKDNSNVLSLLSGKSPNKFNRSSKTNINYITLFNEKTNINTIPIECFNKWINIWSINKFIYDSSYGTIKSIIENAEQKKIIRENKKGNKTKIKLIKNTNKGTKSVATKEYTFKEENGDLITLFNNKHYIDFYDIYDNTSLKFFEENVCIKNILSKINMNDIITKLKENKLLIDEDKLNYQIKRNFY